MAREHYPPAFTKDEEVLKYLKGLEDKIRLLENRTTSTLQQTAVTNIDDPIEGEYVVDPTDNLLKWYSNGAWRQPAAGASLPSCRLYKNAAGTVGSGTVNYFNLSGAEVLKNSSIFGLSPAFTPSNAPNIAHNAGEGIQATGGGFFFWMVRFQLNTFTDFLSTNALPLADVVRLLKVGSNWFWYGSYRDPFIHGIDSLKSGQVISQAGFINATGDHLFLPTLTFGNPATLTISTLSLSVTRISDLLS